MKVYQAINAVQRALSKEGITKDRLASGFGAGYAFRGIWGFPDYFVGACGCVFSKKSGRFLKPQKVNGYHHVTLCNGSVSSQKQMTVHSIVAIAFNGNRPKDFVVNHINGNKTDNRAANLEWVSCSENSKHAYRTGLRTLDSAHKERAAALGRKRRSFTDAQAKSIRAEFSNMRGQIIALANKYGLSRYAVANIVGDLK